MAKQKQLKVTLIRSLIGRIPKHKACAQSIGLRKIRQTVVVKDTPCIRGIINKVSYLLSVEEM